MLDDMLLTPIGVTVKPGGKLVIDFEVVVANPISPPGTTGLVIDPGVVYNWGAFATGLRLAFQTNANTNVGLIPLINMGVADLGGSTWFVEAAFPTFIQSELDETPAGAPPVTTHTHGASSTSSCIRASDSSRDRILQLPYRKFASWKGFRCRK